MFKPIEFTESNFDQQVLQSNVPVLVDFWAQWCGPCRAVGPSIERLADEYSASVRIGKLNVDEQSRTAQEFGINSIPAVLIFQNGKVVESLIGVKSQEEYATALDRVLDASTVEAV